MEWNNELKYIIKLNKKFVLDENQKPIAVQIPIMEFKRLEEVIENYGLSKLIDEVADDEQLQYMRKAFLSVFEAKC